ncbi:S-layer protein [Candidatus Woesearchaeota archaeon]|nr:S-layer protein [Candidatus Woesearchaeota archaeon]
MFVVKKEKNEVLSLPAKEIKFSSLKNLGTELAQKILKSISEEPKYPADIAKELKVHEQKVYYHIRNLEKAGIIKIAKKESKQGAIANYYALAEPSFVVPFKEFQKDQKISQVTNESEFLKPFIENGQLNAIIIVGSPDPHGQDKARSRDGYYGIDLALFLGTFLNYVPQFNVKLDTEVRESDLEKNLILIGGPITNKVMERVNGKLPIRFENGNIKSTLSNQLYPEDETGFIVKAKNPFSKDSSILVVAGKRFAGTRAAIIAFLKGFKKIAQGNIHNPSIKAKVVEGVDLDSDGIVDDVEFRE